MKNNRILPVGLKGNQINERMMELMGISQINENKSTSAVELTKIGPDGKAYAIIRENHEYYIKTSEKTSGLVVEDFKYIGGLQNKKQEAYPSYAKAIKHLNIKFNSIQEALDTRIDINVFEDDKLLKEDIAGFYSNGNGFSNSLYEEEDTDEVQENPEDPKTNLVAEVEDDEMTDEEKAIDEMLNLEFDKPAMRNFKDQYGDKEGESDYYKTANAQDRNPETFEKNEGYMDEELTGNQDRIDFDILRGMGDETNESWMEEDIESRQMQKDALRNAKTPEEYFNAAGGDDLHIWDVAGDMARRFGRGAEEVLKYLAGAIGGEEVKQHLKNRDMNNDNNPINEGKLSIERAINEMDDLIDSLGEGGLKKKD